MQSLSNYDFPSSKSNKTLVIYDFHLAAVARCSNLLGSIFSISDSTSATGSGFTNMKQQNIHIHVHTKHKTARTSHRSVQIVIMLHSTQEEVVDGNALLIKRAIQTVPKGISYVVNVYIMECLNL